MTRSKDSTPPPYINVTPLIDVLLVMLIIFMVAVPLRPTRFVAQVPSPPDNNQPTDPNPLTLVVTIEPDRTLKLNRLSEDMGTVDDTTKLSVKLASLFAERVRNHTYQKTVFIKAPRNLPYGEVARVMDGLKGAGAAPIGLQLDDLR